MRRGRGEGKWWFSVVDFRGRVYSYVNCIVFNCRIEGKIERSLIITCLFWIFRLFFVLGLFFIWFLVSKRKLGWGRYLVE